MAIGEQGTERIEALIDVGRLRTAACRVCRIKTSFCSARVARRSRIHLEIEIRSRAIEESSVSSRFRRWQPGHGMDVKSSAAIKLVFPSWVCFGRHPPGARHSSVRRSGILARAPLRQASSDFAGAIDERPLDAGPPSEIGEDAARDEARSQRPVVAVRVVAAAD